jgi:TolA-binding protein
MKFIKTVTFSLIALALVSCGNTDEKQEQKVEVKSQMSRQTFIDQIKRYEAEMHKSMTLNPNTAVIAVKAYDDFATYFPNDSLTPDFLFKAGEISTANQQYKQALTYYERITKQYPNFKLKAESLYLQAYLLDNFLNDDAKAKVIYEEVIAKYPDLPYASDAKAAIKNLGKSDEELIKEFERKNKGK